MKPSSDAVFLVEHPIEVRFYALFLRILISVCVYVVCICTHTSHTHNLLVLLLFANFNTLLLSHSVTMYWSGVI